MRCSAPLAHHALLSSMHASRNITNTGKAAKHALCGHCLYDGIMCTCFVQLKEKYSAVWNKEQDHAADHGADHAAGPCSRLHLECLNATDAPAHPYQPHRQSKCIRERIWAYLCTQKTYPPPPPWTRSGLWVGFCVFTILKSWSAPSGSKPATRLNV